MNKIAVSETARAKYVDQARKVWEAEGKGTYGQDMDTVTKLRLLRAICPACAPKSRFAAEGGQLSDAAYSELVQLMKLGSNAHAINVALNDLSGAKKTSATIEYASIG